MQSQKQLTADCYPCGNRPLITASSEDCSIHIAKPDRQLSYVTMAALSQPPYLEANQACFVYSRIYSRIVAACILCLLQHCSCH